MKNEKQIIAIGGQPRSGGSLIARLFDSHPVIASFPTEPDFFLWGNYFENGELLIHDVNNNKEVVESIKYKWRLDKVINNGFSEIKRTIQHFDREKYQFLLNIPLKGKVDSLQAVIIGSEIFFKCWREYNEHCTSWDDVDYIAYHKHDLHTTCIEPLMKTNRLKFIHTIRHPCGLIYSHYKNLKRKSSKKGELINLEAELLSWLYSLLQATYFMKKYPENYRVVRYEDVILDNESFREDICSFLDISNSSIIGKPTIGGVEWYGNSSFESLAGLSGKSVSRFCEFFSNEDYLIVQKVLGKYLDFFGYTCSPPYIKNNFINPSVSVSDLFYLTSRQYFNYNFLRSQADDIRLVRYANKIDKLLKCVLRPLAKNYKTEWSKTSI